MMVLMTVVTLRIIHPSDSSEPQTNQRIKYIFMVVNALFTLLIYALLGSELRHEVTYAILFRKTINNIFGMPFDYIDGQSF